MAAPWARDVWTGRRVCHSERHIRNPSIEPMPQGLLTVLFFTHIFLVLAPTLPHGEIGVLVLVATVIGMPLCAVALKGWWRVVTFMGLLLAANLYGVYVAFQLAGSA